MFLMKLWKIPTMRFNPGQCPQRWKHSLRKLNKVLVANRGEIACRVMRTARRLGVRTVAVYSEADEDALHVSMADEAYKIGPPPATQSYLRGDKILEMARRTDCQGIHPGYGFLSENAEFAEQCEKYGVIFIGPPASAIRDMGIKSKSKEIMFQAGVPIIEGYHGEDQSVSRLKEEAHRIGFPVMIKAVRGGGGKGMRIAFTDSEFEEALASAKSESQKSFGDSVVLLEKFVVEPRHVEVQIFADTYGNAVHLFERDCSVQRRHQKIIEEAPAPGLNADVRGALGAAAVTAAKAVGYVGAGTVEFIMDRRTQNFHFMEMNTRLQVEHPVTEMVTGTDLVEWQLKVAAGDPLPVTQDQILIKGHAFEARIYAEDPRGEFLPGAGTLEYLAAPSSSEAIRIETGVREGDQVSVHYDPMIAKLVVWGQDRAEALRKLQAQLIQYNIAGLETNINFLLDLVRHPKFAAGHVHTNFIKDNHRDLFKDTLPSATQLIQAALVVILKEELQDIKQATDNSDQFNPFLVESNFRINHLLSRAINLKFRDTAVSIEIKFAGYNVFHMSADGGQSWSVVQGELQREDGRVKLKCTIDGVKKQVSVFANDDMVAIFDDSGKTEFSLPKHQFELGELDEDSSGINLNKSVAPMPGIIDKILVKEGDRVAKGDSVFVLIAMKMEYLVKAEKDAVVAEIAHKVGDNVMKDAVVVRYEKSESENT